MKLPQIMLVTEQHVSMRRRITAMVAGGAAVLVGAWQNLYTTPLGAKGLVILVLGGGIAATVSTVVISTIRLDARRDWNATMGALRVLRRAAPAVPRRRIAPVLSDFSGRSDELQYWLAEHARLRRERDLDGGQIQSPVILAMHGPPGVGKSALAHALSRRLLATVVKDGRFVTLPDARGARRRHRDARLYPDGLFVASFNVGGAARGPADVARDLLLQLGWPIDEMPTEAEDRVGILRSLTRGKKMIFLFDAAKDHDQVNQVMPAEPGCLVIITSRREIGKSLGLPPRDPIGPMTLHDALQMFSTVSLTDWTSDAEPAVELVEMCGRFPLAVRAAAERVRDGQGLRYVAASLRPSHNRLQALSYGGRSIGDRIATEFSRLDETQRTALTLLAALPADSFVPWVLRPLMRLPKGQSTDIVNELAAAQFVVQDGVDPTGQGRYRIHPLIRLYANQTPRTGVDEALARLDEAYLDLIDDSLAGYDPTYELIRSGPRRWRSANSTIALKIVPRLDLIVRREYLNLIRIIRVAGPEYATMIWRVAALLDGRAPAFPVGPDSPSDYINKTREAFAMAEAAARSTATVADVSYVRLSLAQFLLTVEHYRDADELLTEVEQELAAAELVAAPEELARAQLRLHRVRAWMFMELGAYERVEKQLDDANTIRHRLTTTSPHVQTDIALIHQFHIDIDRTVASQQWANQLDGPVGSNDIVELHRDLVKIAELRRKRQWDSAAARLRTLLGRDGDARGHTSTHLRLAQLQIEHALFLDERKDPQRESVIREAIQHAAACIFAFGTIGDPVGQIRGRALLVRALVLLPDLAAATQLEIEVQADLAEARKIERADIYLQSLDALCHQARAEVDIAHRRMEEGWRQLVRAVRIFRALKDWASYVDASRLLHETYKKIPKRPPVDETPADKATLAERQGQR